MATKGTKKIQDGSSPHKRFIFVTGSLRRTKKKV